MGNLINFENPRWINRFITQLEKSRLWGYSGRWPAKRVWTPYQGVMGSKMAKNGQNRLFYHEIGVPIAQNRVKSIEIDHFIIKNSVYDPKGSLYSQIGVPGAQNRVKSMILSSKSSIYDHKWCPNRSKSIKINDFINKIEYLWHKCVILSLKWGPQGVPNGQKCWQNPILSTFYVEIAGQIPISWAKRAYGSNLG